jgi:hypothetical protein
MASRTRRYRPGPPRRAGLQEPAHRLDPAQDAVRARCPWPWCRRIYREEIDLLPKHPAGPHAATASSSRSDRALSASERARAATAPASSASASASRASAAVRPLSSWPPPHADGSERRSKARWRNGAGNRSASGRCKAGP